MISNYHFMHEMAILDNIAKTHKGSCSETFKKRSIFRPDLICTYEIVKKYFKKANYGGLREGNKVHFH